VDWLYDVDWEGMFVPDTPILEIFLRGSLVYLALFLLLRFALKRQAGSVGISDLLVIVLIADAAQNALAADYTSVSDGLFLVATIIFWSLAFDWLEFHVPRLRPLFRPSPLPLVRGGQIIPQNMRRELITDDDLMSQLRLQGHDDLSQIRDAYMEADGRISIVTHDDEK
jgi:uncharacterized membrane protein YcaP (DUF421 family)